MLISSQKDNLSKVKLQSIFVTRVSSVSGVEWHEGIVVTCGASFAQEFWLKGSFTHLTILPTREASILINTMFVIQNPDADLKENQVKFHK